MIEGFQQPLTGVTLMPEVINSMPVDGLKCNEFGNGITVAVYIRLVSETSLVL
jgi:hypothetical protein